MTRKLIVTATLLALLIGGCTRGWSASVTNKCDHRVEVWFLEPGATAATRESEGVEVAREIGPGKSFSVGGTLNTVGWDIVVPSTEFLVQARRPVDPDGVTLSFDLDGEACGG